MTSNLMETMQTFEAPPQSPPSQYGGYVQPQPQQSTPVLHPPDPELALTNAPEYQRQLEAYITAREDRLADRMASQLQTYMQPVTSTMGMMARQQVSTDPKYTDVFKRFGHEIDQEFVRNNVPVSNRTPDAYRMVADMVQGRHWRELVKDEASRLAASGALGTVRSRPDASGMTYEPQGDSLDIAWENESSDYFRTARMHGISKSDVREAAKRQGLPIDKWVKMVESADVFVAPDGKRVEMRRHPGEKNA